MACSAHAAAKSSALVSSSRLISATIMGHSSRQNLSLSKVTKPANPSIADRHPDAASDLNHFLLNEPTIGLRH